MSKIISTANFNVFDHHHEKVVELSKTEPSQSMTIRQIVDRFRKGQPVSVGTYDTMYDEGYEMPDMERLDLSEQQEAVFEARRRREEIERNWSESQKKAAAERKAKQDEQDKLFEEWKKERDARSKMPPEAK